MVTEGGLVGSQSALRFPPRPPVRVNVVAARNEVPQPAMWRMRTAHQARSERSSPMTTHQQRPSYEGGFNPQQRQPGGY